MSEVSADELREAVEHLHGCRAKLREVVPVHEEFRGQVVWDGIVHVFDVEGIPGCETCYAWSSPAGEGEKRRFFAVLAQTPIGGPADAIRASIAQQNRPSTNQ